MRASHEAKITGAKSASKKMGAKAISQKMGAKAASQKTVAVKKLAAIKKPAVPQIPSKAPAPAEGVVRKPHRFKPGTVALRQIRKLQRVENNVTRRLPFQRWVRQLAAEIKPEVRFQENALKAFQEVTEKYLVSLFDDAMTTAIQADRITIMGMDLEHVRRIRGERS